MLFQTELLYLLKITDKNKIMILTGKAKEDFIKTKIGNEISLFESMLPIYSNALIIDWFDSVGIYINTTYEEYEDIQVKNLPVKIKTWSVWIKWINELLLEGFNSRQEALTEAIKKANEIYNSTL